MNIDKLLQILESNESYEVVDREVIPKMSHKFSDSRLTMIIWFELSIEAIRRGKVICSAHQTKASLKFWQPLGLAELLWIKYAEGNKQ